MISMYSKYEKNGILSSLHSRLEPPRNLVLGMLVFVTDLFFFFFFDVLRSTLISGSFLSLDGGGVRS